MRRSNVVILSPSAMADLTHHCLSQNFHRYGGRNDQRPFISDDNGNAL